MNEKTIRLSLYLPESLASAITEHYRKTTTTKNAYIMAAVSARVRMDIEGSRRCADGAFCPLNSFAPIQAKKPEKAGA